MGDAGFNYNLVAVFGSQSTGKSNLRSAAFRRRLGLLTKYVEIGTLLNRLFGTDFDVMDDTRRQQTTKGEQWFRHYSYPLLFHSLTDYPTDVILNPHSWPASCYRYLGVQGEEYERAGYGC